MRFRHLRSLLILTLLILSFAATMAPASAGADTWMSIGLTGHGSVPAMAIDPVVPNTLYAGTGSSGVFRSADGGTNWSPINNGITGSFVVGLAINPVTPTTLFAGISLGSLYRSTDGGASWNATSLSGSNEWALAINPANPSIIYVGTWGSGVYRSIDGGITWGTVNAGLPTNAYILRLAINPVNPATLYATTSNSGVFRSTNSGTTWSPINTGLVTSTNIRALIINPATPTTLYVGTDSSGIFKSLDSGASWNAVNTGLPNDQVSALAINPATPTVLYAAIGNNGVFRSTDSGATWGAFSDGLPAFPLVNTLVIDPVTTTTIYAGTNNGVFRVGNSAPTITAQPASKRIHSGQSATLSVIADGTAPLSYQWYLGNTGDTSTPISGATASSYTTPLLTGNASYWVRVSNTVGTVDSATALVITGPFQVSYDGLSFANFSYTSNTSQQSWEAFKKTFPGTQMEVAGQRRKGPEQYFKSANYQQIGVGGNCAGFAAVSLIHYLGLAETVEPSLLSSAHRALALTSDLPAGIPDNVVSVGQSDVMDYLHLYQARQMSYQYGIWWGQHWNDTPLQTYQAVKSRTAANEPVAVSMWQVGRGGHRVTAYRTEESGNTGYIYIYDSNWPNDATRRITINLTTGQWTYTLWTNETWGGLIDLHYSPATINFPAELYPGDSGNAVIYAASGQEGTIVHVDGDADLLITDAQGQQIGYQNNNLVVTIPGAAPIREEAFNPANPTASSIQTFFVPAGSVYTTTVQPMSATSVYTLTAFAGGSALSLDHISATAGSNDSLLLRNGVLDATFTPTTDGTYCDYLTREVSDSNSRDYTTCVTGGKNVPAHISLNPTTNTLTFQHAGSQPLTVSLATTQVGSFTGQGQETVQVAPGTTVTGPPVQGTIYLPVVRK
jgi:hypothetical protein